ncbi:hypothetical protein ACIQBJ_05475 [Kitasatospora sp. NPDC088391]|uniref:hypothetical protein n=1 Tax=Kitasatospora sp. NPDC088391 TaxID=3364074 RepID=UPI003806D689
MTPHRLRPAGVLAGVVLPLAFLTGAAHAAPGDNGDVKVHDSATGVDSQNDDPKVCTFYLDGFNFDAGQSVSWHIDQQPPTGNAQVLSGTLPLPTGHARTVDQSLPNGHYKLFWNFTGENGDAKQKTFMVDCPAPSGSPSPVSGGNPSPSASPSTSTPPSASSSPSAPGRTPQGGVAAGAGGASHGANPAEVAVGAALIAGAAWLVVRRTRNRSRR